MKRKIKIGIIIDQLVAGGVQEAAAEEVYYLRKKGYDARLLILMRRGFDKKFAQDLKINNFEFLSDRMPKILQKSFKLPFFHFFSTLHLLIPIVTPLIVKHNEFDLLISHGTSTCLTAWSLYKYRGIPYFAVIHDSSVYILEKVYSKTALKYFLIILKPIVEIFESGTIKSSRLTIVDSQYQAKYIKKIYGHTAYVNYLGINGKKSALDRKSDYILAFSRWDIGKNPEFILKLATKFTRIPFIVAGTWTNKKDLINFRKMIKSKYHLSNIQIIPFVKKQETSKLFDNALVFLHPNLEAFGLGALEAGSYGCPIVMPKGSGVSELLINGRDGYFPKEGDEKGFIRAIYAITTNPKLAKRMGIDVQKKVKKYTWEKHTNNLIEIIKKTT